ncbi:16S rRNA (adenine(1518)-N(6)/adenine(1519)-N(6))-dimethyltransferase RsmA [Marinimicrobium sp. LS-A18]|uniref:16S rRNA (adenine(1518)-N(6)/adenine(1519)-N(6))- dimethyltransferase RsmA n=1 Tax=Marinimicrobium sp. LS-A18 TaxID=1381596 RepID=UPI0004B30E61|nr:16S rRNA (adenine(1518)-N(6)/adenine(1519)-N(6))-dimethyltransferase RsmA [Marinimicrobium sp. LS-A18]
MSRPGKQRMGNGEAPHRARKRFGQNFLVDGNVIDRIVGAINPQPGELLVEIGPGKGALTARLADKAEHLRVIELDRDLVPWLKVQFEKHPDFELFQADALKFDFTTLMKDEQSLRIVGNLPYNISTPLIFHLLTYAGQVKDMHFMLQKEVVKRMAAGPGEKAYGRLGIMVQYDCQVEPLFEVPPGAFDPAPKVDSAVVRLTPHARRPFTATNRNTLSQLVNVAFQQRRKTLRNALKNLVEPEQLDQLPVDASLRPEALSLEDYVRLANAIDTLNSAS